MKTLSIWDRKGKFIMFIADWFKNKFNNPFIALKHKNFRFYWFGMCISLIGTWMQNIAQPWLAYSLTKSPFLLSLIGALQFTPVLLFSLFAGMFAHLKRLDCFANM